MKKETESRIVEAEAFVLKDGRGRTKAFLTTVEEEPQLHFFDNQGCPRLMIAMKDGKP